ncbi:MAG: hypothetical protein QOE55_6765 [Acidobacteriaceae bacterium]|nr:hypothetical protein [Acidobacteriaceae bacterium]
MQRLSSSLRRPGQRNERVRKFQRSEAPGTFGPAGALGVATLAPAAIPSLPSLEGVPTEYNHEANAELLYELCAALAQYGLGTAHDWELQTKSAAGFAQRAILNGIGKKRNELIQRNVDYSLSVSDAYDRYSYGNTLEKGKLIVKIECGQAGYLELGNVIEALEQQEPGLGEAFYWTLIRSIYRVMYVYDHDAAMQYEEGLWNMAADDDESNRDRYEFPEVEKALPDCIRKSLRHRTKKDYRRYRRLLEKHRNGAFRTWMERLRCMQRIARVNVHAERNELDNYYDGPPVPTLIIAFKQNDAIVACFDEEAQHMLESSPEPALGLEFSPSNPDHVKRVLRVLDRFIQFNCELFLLAEELKKWEARDAGSRRNRREPSLHAA